MDINTILRKYVSNFSSAEFNCYWFIFISNKKYFRDFIELLLKK